MKLKQRVWIFSTIIGGALVFSLFLSIANIQHFDESRAGVGLPTKHLQELQAVNKDKDPDQHQVANLVNALQNLAKPELQDGAPNPALPLDDKSIYKEIVRKLLQDKTFSKAENVDNLINIGKLLEESINRSKAFNDSGALYRGKDKSREALSERSKAVEVEVETPSDRKPYPEFHLSRDAMLALTKHISRHADDHLEAKRKIKSPMSFKIHKGLSLKPWQQWQNSINQHRLYDETKAWFTALMRDMANAPIIGISTLPDYGTQIKLVFKYKDGSQTLYKPMRWKRNRERDPNLYYFDDFERHQAEIAAFHLDRIMKFYRVPPNVGRFVNITTTIEPFSSRSFKKTIFTSPSGNKCFYGKCDYYCDSGHPVCGNPDVVEGALAAWLPFGKGTSKKSWENPWRRSYSKFRKAEWENDPDYCETVKKRVPYNEGRRLLDLMDITIFDYLAGNQDRHHFHTFKVFGNQSSPVLYDNGRGFGFINYDDPSILVPVVQCCQIRYSTLVKLVHYETGPDKLSTLMKRSLTHDPVSSGPYGLVLSDGHLHALDRRVSKVLDTVWRCVRRHNASDVILDDGF